jgi:magnesium transporter
MKNNLAIKFIEDLIKAEPQKAAEVFEAMEFKEAFALFKKLSIENQIKCIKFFNAKYAAKIIARLNPENIKEIFLKTERYKIVSILKNSNEHKFKLLINQLDENLRSSLYYLFEYPKNSAGRIMYPDFISLNKNITVSQAINKLKLLSKLAELKSYIYVIDDENTLVGVLNTRDLILSDDNQKIEEIMIKKVVKIFPHTKKEELIKIFAKKNFISLPVVDTNGKIIGVVESRDIIETAREESIEDMQLLLGASPEESIDSPLNFKIKNRLKWLIINLFTVFLSAAIVALFENTISRITALAITIPIIMGQGTVAGTQTLSVIIRAIVMGEIEISKSKKIILNEIMIGLINGAICGIITGTILAFFKQQFYLGIIVFIAMTLNLIISGISGAFIPLIMKRLNFDPAHSSVVILTTITDIFGLFSLFMLAKLIL